MAQSTEDYLDSLLRQAMGIPEPEPEKKQEAYTPELAKEDVFAMAEGLTGSNSAILGNVYDHNASFTNQGEIEIPAENPAPAAEPAAPAIPAEDMPDPDAPPVMGRTETQETPEYTENLLPEIDASSFAADTQEVSSGDINAGDIPSVEDISSQEPAIEIPSGPVVEHDGNLDILPGPDVVSEAGIEMINEPVLQEAVIEEPLVEETAIEEPVTAETEAEIPAIEEPVMEEPVITEPEAETPVFEEPEITEPEAEIPALEEPVIEEPAVEELTVEEPAAEEPKPAVSIDDLDPNDSAKALDPDMIAALFESANAEADAPAEEPVIEEPAASEPETEIPSLEEPEITEPVEEESKPAISIDDLDPNDSAKALDPDMIAALFESANAEEPAVEEPAVTESEQEESDAFAEADAPLEELDFPSEDAEEEPLMPDQEITDLLSSLDGITGEAKEPSEEEAPADGEESSVDLGDIDMFDTDLSAMLDDVTTNLDLGSLPGADGGEDADLGDLLGSLDDGSGDLSDIGDLLEKDENSELVDPNTETAEALFASDSEEDLFNIDNVIEEEEGSSGKKKKKFSLFKKKKKKGDNVEVIGGDEEMLIDPDLLDIPDESELKKKKGGFLAAFFAKLFEEPDDGEDDGTLIGIDQSAVEIAQEGAAENEAIMSELDAEASGKKGKKEKKKKEKKEKKKKGGEEAGEDGEEAAEDTKKKKKEKKEKKKKEKMPELPGKRLPRKKVVAISLFCITIGLVIIFIAFLYPYSQDIKKAKKFYSTGEYQKTYEYMRGHKLTEEDKLLYDRTVTLLRIKRPYDSYQNYMKMGLRMEALNALVQGVQMSDRYAEDAASLGVIDKYSKLSRSIYDELYNSFGVTVDKARSWLAVEGTPEYTRALYECLKDTSPGNISDEPEPAVMPEEEDSVISSEEKDL